jgi:hypothetical protein
MAVIKKTTANVGNYAEGKEALHPVGGNVN